MDLEEFLAGLRVLAVDDDHVCLKILEMQLRHCKYNVTAVAHAETAIEMLRARKGGDQFDLVISDVHMPNMDGFKLLELVGLEMDIPVIMLSANEEMETMMKGIKHGAYDYLVKPVHLDRLKNIWMHVVKKSRNDPRNYISGADNGSGQKHQSRDAKDEKNSGDETKKYSRKNKKDGDGPQEDDENSSTLKRQRIQWSGDLNRKFVEVVNQIGIDRAVPKKIWELMNVDGISRDHVASHLQKYRQGLKGLSEATNKQSNPFVAEPETWRTDLNYMNTNGLDSSSSALGVYRSLHSHQSVQSMSSQRNLAIPLIWPAGNGGNLLNAAVQDASRLASFANSHSNTSNGGLFFAGPSNGYIENVPNCMALNASRTLCYGISGNSFANVSNGTQPLASGLCNSSNSWNAEVPLMFPSRHSHGISGAPSQGNGIETNKLSGLSGPMMTTVDELQNQMATIIRTSSPVVGFSEQKMPFNLGTNANSISVLNGNSAPASASTTESALTNIQIHNSDMLNHGGGIGNRRENDGTVDQQAAGDFMGTSDAQYQMSGGLVDFVIDWLNRDYQNPNAAIDGDWQ